MLKKKNGSSEKVSEVQSSDPADDILVLEDDLKIKCPQRGCSARIDYFDAQDPVCATYREVIDNVEKWVAARKAHSSRRKKIPLVEIDGSPELDYGDNIAGSSLPKASGSGKKPKIMQSIETPVKKEIKEEDDEVIITGSSNKNNRSESEEEKYGPGSIHGKGRADAIALHVIQLNMEESFSIW